MQEINSYMSGKDAMATMLEGTCEIIPLQKKNILNTNETVHIPAGIPHVVNAVSLMKMFRIVIFPAGP